MWEYYVKNKRKYVALALKSASHNIHIFPYIKVLGLGKILSFEIPSSPLI